MPKATASTASPSKAEVFDVLVEEIRSGKLQPDEPLVERTLAERFGLSRTPIREILRRLHSEHLVEFYPNQGVFVKRLSPRHVRELFQLREALEPLAAALAAENRPDDEIAEVIGGLTPPEAAHGATAQELTRRGQAFHDAIARWTGNRLLHETYMVMRKQTRLVRTIAQSNHESEVRSYHEHCQILEAIQERDAVAAREAMKRHLQRSNAVVLDLIGS